MPIKPENKHLYPDNWKQISEDIRFNRAQNKCECCGLPNHCYVHSQTRSLCLKDEDYAIRIVLTVAHLDHDPTNNEYSNLKAMCQKCYNNHDKEHRKANRKKSKLINQLKLDL
jgi:hypothetical protein